MTTSTMCVVSLYPCFNQWNIFGVEATPLERAFPLYQSTCLCKDLFLTISMMSLN